MYILITIIIVPVYRLQPKYRPLGLYFGGTHSEPLVLQAIFKSYRTIIFFGFSMIIFLKLSGAQVVLHHLVENRILRLGP